VRNNSSLLIRLQPSVQKYNKFETKLTLDEQISYTKQELDTYKNNKYSAKEIVDWLESVYSSLIELKTKLVGDEI